MKSKLLTLFLILLCAGIYSQNGLEKLIVERYYVSDANDAMADNDGGPLPVGSVTYRFYVDMLPGYKFQAAYGVDQAPPGPSPGDHELRIETSTFFFNNEDRGAVTPNFKNNNLDDNTVMLDSWVSVGGAAQNYFGVLKTGDDSMNTIVNSDGVLQNADSTAGIPLTVQDGLLAGSPELTTLVGLSPDINIFDDENDGPVFSTSNGSWACLVGCTGPDSMDNILLIAQITTDGILTYEFNIQIGTPSGGVQNYVSRNPMGNEILLPSLKDTAGLSPANNAPIVNITSPSDGATFSTLDIISITATASDQDGSINLVEFYANGSKIGQDAVSPYQFDWAPTLGTFDLTAVATDDMGAKTTSPAIMVTIDTTIGIEELEDVASVSLFPNPAEDEIVISIAPFVKGRWTYTIYNVTGNLVLKKQLGKIYNSYQESIQLGSLPSGYYYVEFSIGENHFTRKFIKN